MEEKNAPAKRFDVEADGLDETSCAPTAMINLLTFTTLYPNAKRPSHGVFVENRLRELVATGKAKTTVLAPIPYAPDLPGLPDRYKMWTGIPAIEKRHGIDIHHPSYYLLPKISMSTAPLSLYRSARRKLAAMMAEGFAFDLIDAHYFYPDGVAAVMLGRHFGKPVTITARGSDINIIPRYRLPRRMIQWAAAEAAGIITVCEALKTSLIALGAPPEKIRVLRNGVDLVKFNPGDRKAARARLGFAGATLLSVGNLIPLKGHDIAIKALIDLPGTNLAIAGDGPERANLEALAQRTGVADRVRFFGRVAHEALPEMYRAADILLLLSTNEGLANVLLEAMACGTPVVATATGGTPEAITVPEAGELVSERTPEAVAAAIARLMTRRPLPHSVRAHAEQFDWGATTQGQLALFAKILGRGDPLTAPPSTAASLGTRASAAPLDYKTSTALRRNLG